MNPLHYKPSQIAKALVALLTSSIAFLGLLAIVGSTSNIGTLATVGAWAVGAAAFLTPVLVFIKKAEPVIDSLDPPTAP
jgi:hypothetical protein